MGSMLPTLPTVGSGVGIAAAFHTDTSYRTMTECCRRCVTMGDPISRAPPTRRLGKPRPISREWAVRPWVDVFPQRHAAIGSQFIQLRCRCQGWCQDFYPLATGTGCQSYGNELFGGGAMSFHNVTLPSAPNLYSSVFGPPGPGLLPWSHAAFCKMDEGVESGSCCKPTGGTVFNLLTPALTSIGSKPPGVAVHCVTLPSFPNLNSCRVPSAALPLNHTASLNTKGTRGSKPSARPVLRAVHFVTLPSFPSLYS